ncbi:uncharacterized protein LOC127136513 [Lathyrus oleraceus]|uniref:uncharacterized protein LOC127136513 n=1 Tax=Pisum sativum TaxID=3888 RepID=UPI0021CEC8DA|nr:uncharacterized protein LOC127136513 [Pisum sativum]
MVNRNQKADNVIRQIRHDDMAAYNNLAAMVKRIMVRNGINFGLRRPNYTSPLSEYILKAEAPPRTKIPKFIKFSGDTTESTIEHVARYLIEVGDILNNESLRIKFFPSSLIKNSFAWFTILPQSSIHTWNQLERMFHEQFYMGQMKISLKELASIKRKFNEPIDDYLNRFRLLKARCFKQVPEHELVEMIVCGLDYSIRKKLDTHNDDEGSCNGPSDFDENEIDLAELKQGPPYACKVLAPSNGKNPIEPEKNDKFTNKTYTFDLTKCDEIFDLLVKDGQMIVPPSAKVLPLEQRKKRGFCKYHGFLVYKTSQCFLFRDLVYNAIQEGRLKFGDKPLSHMKIDSDPLQVVDAQYTEPEEVNLVKVTNDFNMTEVTEDFINEPVMARISEHLDQEYFNEFIQEVVGDASNKSDNVFNAGVTEDSNLMIVTKETADGFVKIDKAIEGLQL